MSFSISTYYAYQRRQSASPEVKNVPVYASPELKQAVEEILEQNDTCVGYRKVHASLIKRGLLLNLKTTYRTMQFHRLFCSFPKAYVVATTNGNHAYNTYPNRAKGFTPTAPLQLVVADTTYIPLHHGVFVYAAMVMDAYSRKILGCAVGPSNNTELTLAALRQALAERNLTRGCMHHSDRGSTYCADAYIRAIKHYQCIVSMSAKGNCYDNAKMERFFRTLKQEEVYRNQYDTFAEAQAGIFNFVKRYNATRLHQALGYHTPIEYENRVKTKQNELQYAN